MNPNPAPGWYQRPEDPSRVEYWDGAAWHVRPPATASAPPTTPTPPTSPVATVPIATASVATPPPAASTTRPFVAWLRTPAGLITAIIVGIVVLAVLLSSPAGAALVILASFALVVIAIIAIVRRSRAGKASGSLKAPIAALSMAFVLFVSGTASAGTHADGSNDAGNANSSTRALVDETVAEPTRSATPTPTPTPTIEVTVKTVAETESIPYTTSNVDDPGMDKGTTRVATVGVNGTKTIFFDVTYEDGVEVSRTAVEERVSVEPVNEVIAVGSKEPVVVQPDPAPASNCDSNYADACVPIASDVDCAGGSGNGPAYVQGPVRVVGSDIYDLDRDGDGIACD